MSTPILATVRASAATRELIVGLGLCLAVLGVAIASLTSGDYPLSIDRVWATLTGSGQAMEHIIVWNLRLPRLAVALLAGAALGWAGALLQTLLDNPLASPDLMGISGGASVAAVWSSTMWGLTGAPLALAALVGGVSVALALLVLSRGGPGSGDRFVVIGVGLAFLAQALVGFILKRAQISQAQSVLVWTVGSINAATWSQVGLLALILALAAPVVAVVGNALRIYQLGDNRAQSLGMRTSHVRWITVALCVALASTTTALVGPIGFVALCAPPIARRLI